jgi:hypothetical protein
VNGGLPPPHPRVVSIGCRPVVAEKDDDRVVAQTKIVESREQPSDVVIDVRDHAVDARERRVQTFCREGVEVIVGHLERRVRRVEREITEERLALAARDETHRLVREHVGDIPLRLHRPSVVFEIRVEVEIPMSGAKAEELVEALRARRARHVRPVVPLAERAGAIPARTQHFGERHLVTAHRLSPASDTPRSRAQVVAAGQETRPSRRAHGTDEEAIEHDRLGRQPIEVGRVEVWIAARAEIAITLVVGDDEDDVWPAGCSGRGSAADLGSDH